MKRSPLLLAILLVFLASCDEPASSPIGDPLALPAIDVPWTSQQSVVCFGTSLTYGFIWHWDPSQPIQVVPPPPSYSYPALLGATLKIPVYNRGKVGATTGQALQIVVDSVFSRNPALVLLEFGANDFLQQINDSLTEQRLGRLIDTLHSFGSKVVFISFLNSEMITSLPSDHYLANRRGEAWTFLSMLRRVAASRSIPFVEYAMLGIYWNGNLMSDDLHPNEAGYQIMQQNISRTLIKTFQKNGMLK